MKELKINLLQNLIKDYQILHQNIALDLIPKNQIVLCQFVKLRRDYKLENQKKSINFNIFKYFQPSETMHSKLLAMLLDPNGEHGQGNFFIHSFLNRIGMKFNADSDKWLITAELERIDILIKSSSGHVVIIENKSNWAIDQDAQLYRYWYRAMYLPNCKNHKDPSYTLNKPEKFQIIYLAPDEGKIPSNYSLIKCKYIDPKNLKGLPPRLEYNHIKHLTFSRDIVTWLEEILPNFNENHRLREYLIQYIELWKTN